jgi:membrane protease YdiL (CAAX protease family)
MLFFDTKVAHDTRYLWLEPVLALLLIMLYIWRLRGGDEPWTMMIFGLILLSHYWRGESPRDLGFRMTNFRVCFSVFSPFLIFITLFLLAGGMLFHTLRVLNLEKAVVGFLSYCVWGLFQQYLLNAYFVNRLQPISPSAPRAAAIGAACFACVHTPNWFLMIIGFAGAYCSARVWIRYRNLYFLGIAHGAIGSLLYLVVPDAVSHHLTVGPGWFRH